MIPGITYLCDAGAVEAFDTDGETVAETVVRLCAECGGESTLLDECDRCPACADGSRS